MLQSLDPDLDVLPPRCLMFLPRSFCQVGKSGRALWHRRSGAAVEVASSLPKLPALPGTAAEPLDLIKLLNKIVIIVDLCQPTISGSISKPGQTAISHRWQAAARAGSRQNLCEAKGQFYPPARSGERMVQLSVGVISGAEPWVTAGFPCYCKHGCFGKLPSKIALDIE